MRVLWSDNVSLLILNRLAAVSQSKLSMLDRSVVFVS
jgi:hypothetical protein